MESDQFARWNEADEIAAHALGVKLAAPDMEKIMRCICKFPCLDTFAICALCHRKRQGKY